MEDRRPGDGRHHVDSLLMRESLLDKELEAATDDHRPLVRMLREARVRKIGGRSIVDGGGMRPFPSPTPSARPSRAAP